MSAEPLPFVERPVPVAGRAVGSPQGGRDVAPRIAAAVAGGLLVALGIGALVAELQTFSLEAHLFSGLARGAGFELVPGPARGALPEPVGPFDQRAGYTDLRSHVARLEARGFRVVGQAEPTPRLQRIANLGLFPPYAEKVQSGLHIAGRAGATLFETREPARVYTRFEEIPPVLVSTLLFIENRELLDDAAPRRNPALEWDRLAKAVLLRATGPGSPGGSTLATQLEKFRHSPDGITHSPLEKLRQMLSASLRAYRAGPRTLDARRRIVVDYLNSVPLSAAPGAGEVFGLGDGLAAWFAADFAATNHLLAAPFPREDANQRDVARAYTQVLSLLLAQRRPTVLLREHPERLLAQTRRSLRLLAEAGVVPEALRDAALAAPPLPTTPPAADSADVRSARRRAAPVRARLASLLGTRSLYDLDRLDLDVESTLDVPAQERLAEHVERLRDPAAAADAGLLGFRLLEPGTSGGVIFSLNLYERGVDAHRLRVQVDNSGGVLDRSDGVKLDLGSTAKLRTLVTYLESVATIHERLAALPAAERAALDLAPSDRLGRWVREQLRANPRLTLPALLDAALERRVSASPAAAFYTGGGIHRFQNFDASDDARWVSVREALQRSVNLAFIRVMDDVVDHVMAAQLGSDAVLAAPTGDPRRTAYLWRFADWEGGTYLGRAYARFAGLASGEAVARLFAKRRPSPLAAAVALRAIDRDASLEEFAQRLATWASSEHRSPNAVRELYALADPARWSLQDLGYLARVHPLELWLLAHLREHPEATRAEVLDASADARLASYRWLFRSQRRGVQDRRIRMMLEREAFARIHLQWQATGYPFSSLVPSLATALGSSADRPTALAELVGILANDGVRVPIRRIESLRFAADTPYETRLEQTPGKPTRVLRPEVCTAVREVLVATVERGTAVRARNALKHRDGSPAVVGGKTGTGDHRFKSVRGSRVLERPVSRSATFVYLIDDRFFGVVTAVVTGPDAGRHRFTSSLPVQLFSVLLPEVLPALEASAPPEAELAAR